MNYKMIDFWEEVEILNKYITKRWWEYGINCVPEKQITITYKWHTISKKFDMEFIDPKTYDKEHIKQIKEFTKDVTIFRSLIDKNVWSNSDNKVQQKIQSIQEKYNMIKKDEIESYW